MFCRVFAILESQEKRPESLTRAPRFVAAIRTFQDPDGGARVVFVVGRIREQDQEANINAKYIVEDVEVRGVPERDLSPQLQTDLQALSGRPLDAEAAERLAERLKAAFPSYDVTRRMKRGSQAADEPNPGLTYPEVDIQAAGIQRAHPHVIAQEEAHSGGLKSR